MSNVPYLFAGRPPSSGHVDPIAHAELSAALAAYRDAEALTDQLEGYPADLTAAQRARVAVIDPDDDGAAHTPFFEELARAEGRLVEVILQLGRRRPCGAFRESGYLLTCKGVAAGGRLYLAVDLARRYGPGDGPPAYDLVVIDLAGVVGSGGGASCL